MIEVQADKNGGVLKISFSQKVTSSDAEQWMTKTFALVDEMQPGFQLFADLSGLDAMDVACAPFIAKVMDRCNERGISKVIRVIPNPHKDIGLSIMSMFHYDRHVRILTFEDLPKAEAALAQDPQRSTAVRGSDAPALRDNQG